MAFDPGDLLGPYEILERVGAGGMGEVWKARDSRLNRTVALKISKVEFSDRFEREARASAALNHPHICTLHDVGPNYLVMEFVEGEPLKGPLPPARAVEYAAQILDALDAAHHKGVIHRDLKPANILVSRQGVKLLDFGLAKYAGPLAETDATLTQALTGKGEIVGTLQYMSPEQLQGRDADARSDLFAFGCVFYEMLSGRRAFDGASAASVIAAIMEREPAPLEAAPPLDRLIRRCLGKDPEERFQTARDLKAALLWAVEQQPAPAPAPTGRSRWWLAAALAIVSGLACWTVARRTAVEPPAAASPIRFQIVPPHNQGFRDCRISPDGRIVAFLSGDSSGTSQLWVQRLDSLEPRLLTPAELFTFWSPDSRFIAFEQDGKLQKVNVAGGPPQTVCDAELVLGGSWNREGVIIFSGSTGGSPVLFQVNAKGGKAAALTRLDPARGETQHVHPAFLPDGRHFLYTVQSIKPEFAGIYLGSLDAPHARVRLLEDVSNAEFASDTAGADSGYILFVRGESLMAQRFDAASLRLLGEPATVEQKVIRSSIDQFAAFSASRNGILAIGSTVRGYQLTWYDRGGRKLGTVGNPGLFFYPQISPDGKTIVVDEHEARTFTPHIALYTAGRSTPVKFTFTPTLRPLWSPDGRRIAFEAMTSALYTKSSTGAENETLVLPAANIPDGSRLPCDWSRDGRLLIYSERDPKTGFDLWMLPLDGKRAPVRLLQSEFNERCGALSPDGRWIAYSSDEPGRSEIYVQPFDAGGALSGRKWQISNGGGAWPRWRRDGRELFYLSGDRRLTAVEVKADSTFQPGTAQPLFPTGIFNQDTRFDVSADGARFIVPSVTGETTAPPLVIVNWSSQLGAKAGP